MQKRLLVVANKSPWVTPQVLAPLVDFFKPKLDLQIEIDYTSYNPIPFSPATAMSGQDNKLETGLLVDGTWYDEHVTLLGYSFDIVLFVVDKSQWPTFDPFAGARTDKDQGPVETQISTYQGENIYYPDGRVVPTIIEYSRHEILHALSMITGSPDTIHQHLEQPELALADIVFVAPNVVPPTTIIQNIFQRIAPPVGYSKKIVTWASAIQTHEGYYPGSRSFRNNNPGNVGYCGQLYTLGKDRGGFAIFDTYQHGFDYLCRMLYRAATGQSLIYNPSMTLLEFFGKYASRPGDGPAAYANEVAKALGVSVTTPIRLLV